MASDQVAESGDRDGCGGVALDATRPWRRILGRAHSVALPASQPLVVLLRPLCGRTTSFATTKRYAFGVPVRSAAPSDQRVRSTNVCPSRTAPSSKVRGSQMN